MRRLFMFLIVFLLIFCTGCGTAEASIGGVEPTPIPEPLSSGMTPEQEFAVVRSAAEMVCNNAVDRIFRSGGYKNSPVCINTIMYFYIQHDYWPGKGLNHYGGTDAFYVALNISHKWGINATDRLILMEEMYWGKIGLEGIGIKE